MKRQKPQRLGTVQKKVVAAPIDTFVTPVTPQVRDSSGLDKLAEGLSGISKEVGAYYIEKKKAHEAEQLKNVPALAERLRQDKALGGVTQAQIGERLPEQSATVVAKITEYLGTIKGKDLANEGVNAILKDDSIRLNTQNRAQAKEAVKQKVMEQFGGDLLAASGALRSVDKTFNQYEHAWQQETARYHEKIQTDGFKVEVSDAIRAEDWGLVMTLDQNAGNATSLDQLQRKKAVIDTVIDVAKETGDVSKLHSVPTVFLNAENKAKLAETEHRIMSSKYADWQHGVQFQKEQQVQHIRQSKTAIIEQAASGKNIKPLDYKDPEVFAFAKSIASSSNVNPVTSKQEASKFAHRLSVAGTTGNYVNAFKDDPEFVKEFGDVTNVNVDELTDFVASRSDMTPQDKKTLMDKLPKLMDGADYMRNPDFTAGFKNGLESRIKTKLDDVVAGVYLKFSGVDVRGEIQQAYQESVRTQVLAYMDDNKDTLPNASGRREIIKQAVEEANAKLDYFADNAQELMSQHLGGTSGSRGQRGGATVANTQQQPAQQSPNKANVTKVFDPATGTFKEVTNK